MPEELQVHIHGDDSLPTLVYLPGLHGDWTLGTGFRLALAGRVRFVEVIYPRSLTWNIRDYANAIEEALVNRGITRGWLLGESFGSQIAWTLVEKSLQAGEPGQMSDPETLFEVQGLILAGGFVKHPWKWGPGVLKWIGERTPMWFYRIEMKFFLRYARFRHHGRLEMIESIREFVARRTELDREATRYRLDLLERYDPRPMARRTQLPVYYLAGLADPLVPWILVRWWLRKNCPGYRGGKTFWLADHNVLATAPVRAADLVAKWIRGCRPKSRQ